MKNIYFKGLDEALNNGCSIKVFSCSLRYMVARVYKKSDLEEQLVSYAEAGNILASLNSVSNKIVDELSGKKDFKQIWCERTLIDNIVEQGYSLQIFKLSNEQILSTICVSVYGNNIPVKSAMGNDVESSLNFLNESLKSFNYDKAQDFDEFVSKQIDPICEYQKKLRKEKVKINNK